MGASKEMFLKMRELEYAHDFSKKLAQQKGAELSEKIKDEGNISVPDAVTRLTRLSEVVNTSLKDLKKDLDFEDKELSLNGVKFSKVEGGPIYDFETDAVWQHYNNEINKLKANQKEREKILIKSYKENQKPDRKKEIYDEGEIVEPIELKGYRKSYIKMTW